MNRENLQRAADYIRTIPKSAFNMRRYRESNDPWNSKIDTGHRCNSVGCVIGHTTFVDPSAADIVFDSISVFEEWTERFFDIEVHSHEWQWCFGTRWTTIDNTPEGAALRIEWLLNHGLPDRWYDQMYGYVPLCYMKQTPQP